MKRIVIVGAGAVGGSIGARLQRSGFPVLLVVRGEHGRVIRRKGLCLKTAEDSVRVHPQALDEIGSVDWQNGDLVLVAAKSQDAEVIFDEILRSAAPALPVVCASNGMQCEHWAAARFDTVLSMLVWMPATHLVPGEVCIHASGCIGVLDVGPHCGIAAADLSLQLCRELRAAGFDSVARDDIRRWKYAKWITNLGNTAQALVSDEWRKVAALAQAEGEAVLTKAGVDRVTTGDLHARTAAVRLARIDGEQRRGGSTWQSRVRGKPLETPWIEGAMADLADRLGVPAPVNRMLTINAEHSREMTAQEFLSAAGVDADNVSPGRLAGDPD
ncbi:MAG: ketopantoate reductase family protein [Gammaproteobacteria bacterium]|nr:ketopantoate reductase family protein [Gammaproteobacteria bacterium]